MKKINLIKKDYEKKMKVFTKGLRGKLIKFILRHSIEEYFDRVNNYIYVKDYYCMDCEEELIKLCTNVTLFEYRCLSIEEREELFRKVRMDILYDVSIEYNKKVVEKEKIKVKK